MSLRGESVAAGSSSGASLLSWMGLVLTALLGLAAGIQPLTDPDIGWHLVGGLSMLDSGSVPWRDPIGVEGARWISYSWLFELLVGYSYLLGGFPSLHLLQIALVAVSAIALLLVLRAAEGSPRTSWNGIVEIFSIGFALLFFAPFWHLRPQIVSVVLFAVFVLLGEKKQLSIAAAFLLTAFWASVHVFWVFGPLLYGLYRAYGAAPSLRSVLHGIAGAGVVLLAAVVSPYAVWNLEPPFLYLLFHKTAYRFIVEFQSLVEVRTLLLVAVAHAIWIASGGKALVRRAGLPLYILYVVFFAATLLQRKYLPFVGVTGMLLSVRRLSGGSEVFPAAQECFRGAVVAVVAIAAGFLARSELLAPKWEELLDAGKVLAQDVSGKRNPSEVILNHFNDGGWLGLALYLARSSGETESPIKCWIDGRTLVAGGDRLDIFAVMLEQSARRCRVFEQLRYRFALVPKSRSGAPSEIERCGVAVRDLYSGKYWRILERSGT